MNITKKQLKDMILEEFQQELDVANQTITGRPDHEIEMAHRQLEKAVKYAQSLSARMQNMEEANLPAWVQAKVTKASDYLSSVYHYMDKYLDYAIEPGDAPINEMMDIDPTMVAGAMAGLGSLWYMIKAMKDSVEAGRSKEAAEYMADIHRIMAKNGLKVPPSPSGGPSPKRADAMRQLADLKAKRQFKRLPEPEPEPEPEMDSDIPMIADMDAAMPVEIDSKDLKRYTNIVNTVRNNAGLRGSNFDAAPPQIQSVVNSTIEKIAKNLINKYGKKNLDRAMAATGGIYEQ